MDKTLSKAGASLSKEQIALGKEYVNRLNLSTSVRSMMQ